MLHSSEDIQAEMSHGKKMYQIAFFSPEIQKSMTFYRICARLKMEHLIFFVQVVKQICKKTPYFPAT